MAPRKLVARSKSGPSKNVRITKGRRKVSIKSEKVKKERVTVKGERGRKVKGERKNVKGERKHKVKSQRKGPVPRQTSVQKARSKPLGPKPTGDTKADIEAQKKWQWAAASRRYRAKRAALKQKILGRLGKTQRQIVRTDQWKPERPRPGATAAEKKRLRLKNNAHAARLYRRRQTALMNELKKMTSEDIINKLARGGMDCPISLDGADQQVARAPRTRRKGRKGAPPPKVMNAVVCIKKEEEEEALEPFKQFIAEFGGLPPAVEKYLQKLREE